MLPEWLFSVKILEEGDSYSVFNCFAVKGFTYVEQGRMYGNKAQIQPYI